MATAGRTLAILAAFLSTGCAEPQGPDVDPGLATAPPEAPRDRLTLVEAANFTAIIPYASDTPFRLADADFTMTGPRWKYFGFYYFDAQTKNAPYALGHFGEMQERVQRYTEDPFSGARTIDCLEDHPGPDCPLSAAPQGDADKGWIYSGREVPAGPGYFLLHAQFNGTLSLNVSFDRPIHLGAPMHQPDAFRIVTMDQFDSRLADVRHCGNVYACGVMENASFGLATPAHQYVWTQFFGRSGAGGNIVFCIEEGGERTCPAPSPSLSGNLRHTHFRLLPGQNAVFWHVDGYGPGPEGRAQASFIFYGVLVGFSLPPTHPFQ